MGDACVPVDISGPPLARAMRLIRRAAALYDADPALHRAALRARGAGFWGGARWMARGLAGLRGEDAQALAPSEPWRWQALGVLKYGACAVAGVAPVALGALLGRWETVALGLVAVVPAFYAVEAQLVFVFPLMLDRVDAPLRASRRLTVAAGGTVSVMLTVLPLAATMLFGGIVGRGAVRCWCIGCMGVLLWYDALVQSGCAPKTARIGAVMARASR